MRVVVSRESYFTAAMTILAQDGVGRLKIAPLCRALNVTSGSFYGYFGSLQGFIDEFMAHWEATLTEQIVALVSIEPDPVLRIHALKELAGALPHDAEAAIRSWSYSNESVADVLDRVDRRREEILRDQLALSVGDDRARILATVGMTMLVGLQQWHRPVSRADYELVFTEFERLVLSSIPSSLAGLQD